MTTARLEGLHTGEELAAAARSSLYLRLATAFAFPTAELAESLASGHFADGLAAEAAALPFDLALSGEAVSPLAGPSLAREALEQAYIRLFEVGPGRPPCPLYEGSHRGGRIKIMEELIRFYEHFGLRPQPGDQPDHLCAQLEFMHYLAFKEAAALAGGGPSGAYVLAQRDFLSRRLGGWLPRLRARLEELDAPPVYATLARLADAFCRADLAWLRKRGAKPDTEIGPLPD
ncbi:MAG TPA: molecular chaperone TorD family protein [Dehalococcoidia bacterium]|nr:molecular chaperone TorD family protein [Dehalococcoidia bacterium]